MNQIHDTFCLTAKDETGHFEQRKKRNKRWKIKRSEGQVKVIMKLDYEIIQWRESLVRDQTTAESHLDSGHPWVSRLGQEDFKKGIASFQL